MFYMFYFIFSLQCVLSFFLLLLFWLLLKEFYIIHIMHGLSIHCVFFPFVFNFLEKRILLMREIKEVSSLSDTKMWTIWKITKRKLKKVTILIQSIKVNQLYKTIKSRWRVLKNTSLWCRGLFWGFFEHLFLFYCLCISLVAGSCFLKRKLASLLIIFFEWKRAPLYW